MPVYSTVAIFFVPYFFVFQCIDVFVLQKKQKKLVGFAEMYYFCTRNLQGKTFLDVSSTGLVVQFG